MGIVVVLQAKKISPLRGILITAIETVFNQQG
jgi:hypothetical protein